jgi:CheY-like chemotaxis protein
VLAVQDTGTGINPEHIGKVLEPFFTTKEIGKGTGLGLSTVHGFACQSGGTLRIESSLGQGTRVELWLPRSVEAAPAAPMPAQPALLRVPRLGPAPEILLVDDSGALRELTAAMLRDHGYEVTGAAGGAEALALIEKEPDRFDLIVTDFAMPMVSGLDVVRFARSHRADWPAIILSGYADASAIRDRPADVPLLGKPFSDEALLGAVHEQLALGSQPRLRAAGG